jgi:hypothetical protein
MPNCLSRVAETVCDGSADLSLLEEALDAAVPEPRDQAPTLFDWFGHGESRWRGFPSYESVPEKMLMHIPSAYLS